MRGKHCSHIGRRKKFLGGYSVSDSEASVNSGCHDLPLPSMGPLLFLILAANDTMVMHLMSSDISMATVG